MLAVAMGIVAAGCASPQSARPALAASAVADEQQRQSQFVLEHRASEYARVYEITQRISHANVEFCARRSRTIGVRLENLHDYGRDFRQAAQTLWQLDNTPRVLWVGSGSPAETAGLRVGDRILAINGHAIESNRQASRRASSAIRDAAEVGAVQLRIQRGVEALDVSATPRDDCGYELYMLDDDTLNAAADGRTIYVTRGMLRFARTDEELALILSHELAHNAMGHIEARMQNQMVGMAGGLVLDVLAAAAGVNTGGAFTDAAGDVGAMLFSQEFEAEADYIGLYFMARGGYDVAGAEVFWRRMAAEYPRGIRFAYTHPNTAQRFVAIAATRDEIGAKVAGGQPLQPNMREGRSSSQPVSALTYGEGDDVVSFSEARTLTFSCPSSRVLRIEFEQAQATVNETRRPRIRMQRATAESGFRYTDGPYELTGTTSEIRFRVGNSEPMTCARSDW
ncbi:MAG: M48 family metalloprotease [Hyphomonadaceae bacterium]